MLQRGGLYGAPAGSQRPWVPGPCGLRRADGRNRPPATFAAAAPRAGFRAVGLILERADDGAEVVDERLGAACRQRRDDGLLDATDDRLGSLQDIVAIGGDRDCVGARIRPRAPAFQEPLADHGLHNLRDGGTVDSGGINDVLLARAVLIHRGNQHDVLARCEVDAGHFRLIKLRGALADAVQQMQRGAVQVGLACHWKIALLVGLPRAAGSTIPCYRALRPGQIDRGH